MKRALPCSVFLGLLIAAAGCAPSTPAGFKPINAEAVLLWDRQTTEYATFLAQIVSEFNAGRQGLPVVVEYVGGYTEIYRKVTTNIQAGVLPAMAAAYQNMTAEYIEADAVLPFDTLIHDAEIGLNQEEMDDFFPSIIESNIYPEHEGKMYSFPFCKSVLMLYFNKRVLAEAGLSGPPKTWDEFIEQARQIKAKTGKKACAIHVDASGIDGIIFSLGGEVYANGVTLFDSPQSLKAFELFEIMAKEGLAYQIPPGSYDDRDALVRNEVAYTLRTSAQRFYVEQLMDDPNAWGMAPIPQGDPAHPCTVLFGPNVCIFRTTEEQQRIAWQFIKLFTSKEVNVRWALGTGYVPLRKSAANDPAMQAFWQKWPYNRAAFDCLPFARTEPNIAGWQEVRDLIEKAQTAVLQGMKTAAAAAAELKRDADAALNRR